MHDLAHKTCSPCSGRGSPMEYTAATALLRRLPGWAIEEEHHLSRTYRFKDFKRALAFVNEVGELAEREGHHPDISISFGRVRLDLFTHKVNGLTENDFVLAAKVDALIAGEREADVA